MYKYIAEIQEGNFEHFNELQERFRPLIYHWLIQTKKLATNQRDDLLADAKLILLECVLSYDQSKNVPFESYFKISLYHWYSNKYRKKKIETVSLDNVIGNDHSNVESDVAKSLFCDLVKKITESMSELDQQVIHYTIEGYGPREISNLLNANYRKIRNRKTLSIAKIRKQLAKLGIDYTLGGWDL